MPQALNTGTCIQQGYLFYSAGQHRKKIGRVFGKNAGEWTGRVEISKEELPGRKRSMSLNLNTETQFLLKTLWLIMYCHSKFGCKSISSSEAIAEIVIF